VLAYEVFVALVEQLEVELEVAGDNPVFSHGDLLHEVSLQTLEEHRKLHRLHLQKVVLEQS